MRGSLRRKAWVVTGICDLEGKNDWSWHQWKSIPNWIRKTLMQLQDRGKGNTLISPKSPSEGVNNDEKKRSYVHIKPNSAIGEKISKGFGLKSLLKSDIAAGKREQSKKKGERNRTPLGLGKKKKMEARKKQEPACVVPVAGE